MPTYCACACAPIQCELIRGGLQEYDNSSVGEDEHFAARHVRAALLDFLSGEDQTAESSLILPPTLQRIILERHASRLARFMAQGYPAAFNSSTCHALENADRGRKLLIIDEGRQAMDPALPTHNVRRDWEERIVGGVGCWIEGRTGGDASNSQLD